MFWWWHSGVVTHQTVWLENSFTVIKSKSCQIFGLLDKPLWIFGSITLLLTFHQIEVFKSFFWSLNLRTELLFSCEALVSSPERLIVRFMLQSWKERARTRAAHPQEGGHQNTGFGRRDRPRRPGEHALPGLLQRQGQTDQRSAVWGVSDNEGMREQKVIYKTTHEADWKGGRHWDGEEKYIRDCLTNCQLDKLFHLISCDDEPSFCSSLNCWVLSSRSSLFVSTVTTRKRWSTSCCWTGRRGIPATRTRTCHRATRSVCQSNQYLCWSIHECLNDYLVFC